MDPAHLIDTARKLLDSRAGRPRQADLKRAISTAYYAMFHALCRNSADCLVGKTGAKKSRRAWRQMYRSTEHGFARAQCENNQVMERFPDEIQEFAAKFIELQKMRHEADYDPDSQYWLADAQTWIDAAEFYIARLNKAQMRDRCAFAVWVAVKNRP